MTARPQRLTGFARFALLAAFLGATLTPMGVCAAEFVNPPGMNVGMQEDQLRDRVTRIAKDLAGDNVVDVIVHIGYVRQEKTNTGAGGGNARVKLPGLNNFVSGSGGNVEVTPEFIRLRQVLVVVSNDIADKAKALETNIRNQGQLDPSRGDWIQVAPVSNATAQPNLDFKSKASGKPDTSAAAPQDTQDVQKSTAPFKPKEDLLKEPQSTLYLISARAAYFKGDYNTALDQILQSIQAKPDNPQAYAMMGSLYYAMNWKSLALKYWEKSLALDTGNRELETLVTQLRLEQN